MQAERNGKADQSENVAYDMADFPVYIRRGHLSSYPNFSAISHWHDDIELLYILSRHMHYNVNGRTVLLCEGEGIFINTRQFHHGYSKDFTETFGKVFGCTPTEYRGRQGGRAAGRIRI